jgi:hypothetical protein
MNRSINQYGIVIAVLLAALIQTSEAGSWGRSVTIQNAQGITHRRISGTYGGGTATRYATTTIPDGRTFTNSTTAKRTANGWNVNGQYTNGAGGTGHYSSNVVLAPGVTTKNQQLTTASGETYYRKVQTTYGNGSATRTITLTNPDGTSQSSTVTVTPN